MISSSQDSLSERILSRIAQAGSIETISRSSMISSIVAAFSDEIIRAKTDLSSIVRGGLIPYATRETLEAIGVGMGLPRLVNTPKVISKASGVAKIIYGNNEVIPDKMNGLTIVTTGESFDCGSFMIVALEDIVLEAGVPETSMAVSIFPKSEYVDIYISPGSIYETSISTRFATERFSVKFSNGIIVSKIQEPLEDYRARLTFNASSAIKGSERDLIMAIMAAVPMLTYSINKMENNRIRVGIVDNAYGRTGIMPLYDQYEHVISQTVKRYSRYGVRYEIFRPEISDIKIQIKYSSDAVSESSIVEAFSSAYTYGGSTRLLDVLLIAATRAGIRPYDIEITYAGYVDPSTMIELPLSIDEELSSPEYCFRLLLDNTSRIF